MESNVSLMNSLSMSKDIYEQLNSQEIQPSDFKKIVSLFLSQNIDDKFKFTDEVMNTLEFLQVPGYVIEYIRSARNVFCDDTYSKDPKLYGIGLNLASIFDQMDRECVM